MKFLPAQFAFILQGGDSRRNLRIMWTVEGQRHSWLTGLYWTLTVVSTQGFGDITFNGPSS